MSPDLAATFAAVAGQLTTLFGCAAVYTDAAGDEHAVAVVLSRAQAAVGAYATASETQWRAEIAAAALPTAPVPGESFTVAADVLAAVLTDPDRAGEPAVFTVRAIAAGDGFTWTLEVTLDAL